MSDRLLTRFLGSRSAGSLVVALILTHLVGLADANSIVNGGFETGDLTGWTLRFTPNGQTAAQDVVLYDIDGNGGPFGISRAARFDVSQVVFQNGVPAGIELVQNVSLQGGLPYVLGADLSVLRPVPVTNLFGGGFDLLVNNLIFDVYDAGDIVGLVPEFGKLGATFMPASDGIFEVGLRITRPAQAALIFQFVDNVTLEPVPEPATLLLLGTTAVGIGMARLRQRRAKHGSRDAKKLP